MQYKRLPYDIAPVAQRIECRPPEPKAEVRFLSGVDISPVDTSKGILYAHEFFTRYASVTNIGNLLKTDEISSLFAQDVALYSKQHSGLIAVLLPSDLTDRLSSLKAEQLRQSATVIWEKPDQKTQMFGFGKAIELKGNDESTLQEGIQEVRKTLATTQGNSEALSELKCFGGARFDPQSTRYDELWKPYGNWSFLIPELLITQRENVVKALLVLNIKNQNTLSELEKNIEHLLTNIAEPDNLPDCSSPVQNTRPVTEEWNKAIQVALNEIEKGTYKKVVLATKIKLQTEQCFNTTQVLTSLVQDYPNCYIFKLDLGEKDDYTWLGASPELLVNFFQGTVNASSLASSARRSENATEDLKLGEELLSNQKELLEHELVVQTTRETLENLCTSVTVPQHPELLKMPNIQHLHTPITGTANKNRDLLDFLQNLHPTPAVGGWPKEKALDAIRRLENFDRGWYAGPIGWVNHSGEGEFAVALRSALVGENEAILYAGAGIVKGSEPANELNETKLKLQPLLEALSAN